MIRFPRRLPVSARLQRALGFLALVFVIGTVGYMLLAGMSFIDAAYQTVTTLTTVGFREVVPFGTEEKVFTIFLMLGGVGAALYTLTLVVEEGLEGNVRSRFYQRRMTVEIERMEDHYIICGFGRVGAEIARELHERGRAFVIVEETPETAARARAFGYHVLEGDASDERILVEAGLNRARCLLAASDSDAGNTYITLTARSVNPSAFIVARVALPHNEEKLRLAGADRVVSLYAMGGRRMVLQALQPLAADFMDTLAMGRQGDLVLTEFEANKDNGLVGVSMDHLIAGTTNVTVLGINRGGGSIEVGPHQDAVLQDGDVVIVLASEDDLSLMRSGRW
ncbi:MAG: TrkA family potassium uptake protein [Dehalococcoidia bacterium]